MVVTEPPGTGRRGFWGSLPGVLTALAGLVTALGTAALGVHEAQQKGSPPPPVSISIQSPAAAPSGGQAGASGVAGSQVTEEIPSDADGEVRSLADACQGGDAQACLALLDSFASACYGGDLLACDALYEVSPSGSDYQYYGATCGGRASTDYADRCSGSA